MARSSGTFLLDPLFYRSVRYALGLHFADLVHMGIQTETLAKVADTKGSSVRQ